MTKFIKSLLFAAISLLATTNTNILYAQDASFGCKVLLCAAATNPNWSAIPYCVPPMQQLFSQLAKGKPWPTCPEGNTGGLGYDPFQACPAPRVPFTQTGTGDDRLSTDPNDQNLCIDKSKTTQKCSGVGESGEYCTTTYDTIPRLTTTTPYYVDITTANGVQRFSFNLNGY